MNEKKAYLKELLKYIPSGAQTLSKNPSQYVIGVSPLAIKKAKGCYIWDVEGKKYLDTVLALGPMILGYANPEVDKAVKEQINKGVIYSLPSEHELTLAKLLKKVVPCAEMSRFYMNGNDVTSGAIRLARHITGRDHIAKCGYHGWQDWSICTKEGRNSGVPKIIKTLTHDFIYNDISSLEKIFKDNPNKIAAVILEPASAEKPQNNFLKKVQAAAKKNGALLIFDEMVTGFRWSLGGAQEYYKVIPDLACFGKAISNGYPISALCGRAKCMNRMDEVFVSTTYGGHALGLVAAIAVIRIMKKNKRMHKYMREIGDYFMNETNKTCKNLKVPVEFVGYGAHPIMKIKISDDYTNRLLKTFIYEEMNKAGILFSSSMLFGVCHSKNDVEKILKEFKKVALKISKFKNITDLKPLLKGEIVAPRAVRSVQ